MSPRRDLPLVRLLASVTALVAVSLSTAVVASSDVSASPAPPPVTLQTAAITAAAASHAKPTTVFGRGTSDVTP